MHFSAGWPPITAEDVARAADYDARLTILGRCECGAVRDVREIADYPRPGTTYLEPYCPGCGQVPGFDDPLPPLA